MQGGLSQGILRFTKTSIGVSSPGILNLTEAMTPISAAIPEKSIYLTSLSKTLSPGLRLDFLVRMALLEELVETLCVTHLEAMPCVTFVGVIDNDLWCWYYIQHESS
jgi:hypothetical protein